MPQKGEKRPITQAIELLLGATSTENGVYLTARQYGMLIGLLTPLNAASGTTDARSAKRRAATKKRAAKRAK